MSRTVVRLTDQQIGEQNKNSGKNKLHAIADYLEDLRNTPILVVPEDQYQEIDGKLYLRRRAGQVTESEEQRIAADLKRLGCKQAFVSGSRFSYTQKLDIRVEIDL